jgi:hypothetical protein
MAPASPGTARSGRCFPELQPVPARPGPRAETGRITRRLGQPAGTSRTQRRRHLSAVCHLLDSKQASGSFGRGVPCCIHSSDPDRVCATGQSALESPDQLPIDRARAHGAAPEPLAPGVSDLDTHVSSTTAVLTVVQSIANTHGPAVPDPRREGPRDGCSGIDPNAGLNGGPHAPEPSQARTWKYHTPSARPA